MAPDMPAPPEAEVIRLARMAARMTVDDAVTAVRAAGGTISATYWRDIERGHGGRRGQRVPARASEGLLAQMAAAVGATPDQLAGAGRRDAARVLEEMRRREPERDAEVIPFPAGAADPIHRTLAVQRILGHPIDPDDEAAQDFLRLPLPPERIAEMIRRLFEIRAEHLSGEHGTGSQRR